MDTDIYQRILELSKITRSNIRKALTNINLIPDLQNIVSEYVIAPDTLKAYRIDINYHIISHDFSYTLNKKLTGYNINTIIITNNIYDAMIKIEAEIVRQKQEAQKMEIKLTGDAYFDNKQIYERENLEIEFRFVDNYTFDLFRKNYDIEEKSRKIINSYIDKLIEIFTDNNEPFKIIESKVVI